MSLFSAGMRLPRLLSCALVLALAACGTAQQRAEKGELATSSDRTAAHKRAQIRLQLAIGYLEQRQFDVALDEEFFADAVGEELVAGIGAHVDEGQHGDGFLQ